MKKIFSYILIIATVAIITGCGTTKTYVGEAKGISKNKEVSREISRLNAASEAAIKNAYSVEVVESIKTTDKSGETQTVFTSTKTGSSRVDFADNKTNITTRRRGGVYESTTTFSGKVSKKKGER